MDDVKSEICRLCLEIIQTGSFKLFKNIELDMLDVLVPKDLCIKSGSAMCISCHKNLLACYHFKSVCLETNERKKTLEERVLNYEGTQPTKVKVCSLCFENIDDEMMREIFLGVKGTLLAIMLEMCLPELNTHQMNMAGCTKCFISLEVLFSFINKWLITEEKLEKYCTEESINKNELKLPKVVRFFQSFSRNIAHPQIENSRISSNYGDLTSTNHLLISNIKSEPGQDVLNITERNEETLNASYINKNPETIQVNNLISSSNSKFISVNNFSHPNVKLEPVEDIHEFMGRNQSSYLDNCYSDINNTEQTQIDNDLISSNYNVISSNDSCHPSSPCREFTNIKDVTTIEQNEVNMEEGLLPPDLCQDPSALAMPDFANLNQATQRESRRSDSDDDPDKKRRKCMHTTATNPVYEVLPIPTTAATPLREAPQKLQSALGETTAEGTQRPSPPRTTAITAPFKRKRRRGGKRHRKRHRGEDRPKEDQTGRVYEVPPVPTTAAPPLREAPRKPQSAPGKTTAEGTQPPSAPRTTASTESGRNLENNRHRRAGKHYPYRKYNHWENRQREDQTGRVYEVTRRYRDQSL